MPACKDFIEKIDASECLKNSLPKINSNFKQLETIACNLKNRIDDLRQIRTFFYYGPNAQNDPTSGMDNNNLSYPSNQTIKAFVNSESQLNLPSISKIHDVAYVYYQKTGFTTTLGNSISLQNLPQTITNIDNITSFAPTIIIWRLTYNGLEYDTDIGFPKFTVAQTNNVNNWNDPATWNQFSNI